MTEPVQIVILAAGLGSRLGELTQNHPKAMVPVADRELIRRVFDATEHPDVSEHVVVTGYQHEVFAAFLKEHYPKATIVQNPHFRDGSIRSIEAALPHIQGDFLLMNVDHIYPRRMIARVLDERKGLTAICDFDRELGADDMKIKRHPDGTLARIRKTLTDFDGGYIGMTACTADRLAEYREAVAATRREEGDAASVEWVLGWLARQGRPITICNVSGLRWLEVDTPEDRALAETTLHREQDFCV